MNAAAILVRSHRTAAGLTQATLAKRAGTTQSAIARLESGAISPRLDTLGAVLAACGRRLVLEAPAMEIDESLVAANLELTPGERLLAFERWYAEIRELQLAARAARGEAA